MRHSRRVPDTFHIERAANGLHVELSLKVNRLDPEIMLRKFPNIETQPDYHRELRMNTGKIPRDNRIERPYDSKFTASLLGKITKRKNFSFHIVIITEISVLE
jgi:hypothetical protein